MEPAERLPIGDRASRPGLGGDMKNKTSQILCLLERGARQAPGATAVRDRARAHRQHPARDVHPGTGGGRLLSSPRRHPHFRMLRRRTARHRLPRPMATGRSRSDRRAAGDPCHSGGVGTIDTDATAPTAAPRASKHCCCRWSTPANSSTASSARSAAPIRPSGSAASGSRRIGSSGHEVIWPDGRPLRGAGGRRAGGRRSIPTPGRPPPRTLGPAPIPRLRRRLRTKPERD